MLATYIVAFSAMLLAAVSALTLIYTVNRFDSDTASRVEVERRPKAAA